MPATVSTAGSAQLSDRDRVAAEPAPEQRDEATTRRRQVVGAAERWLHAPEKPGAGRNSDQGQSETAAAELSLIWRMTGETDLVEKLAQGSGRAGRGEED